MAELGGDPTALEAGKPGIETSAVTSTMTCSFPTPSSFLAGRYHRVRVLLEEGPGSSDLDADLVYLWIQEGDAPPIASRVDKVSARLDASLAEAFRELVVLRNEGEPLVFHHTPTRGRSWSMPYLARLGERPRLVNVRPGTTRDVDQYEVTVEAREVRL